MGEGGVGRSIESKLNKLSWKARELIDRNSFQMTSSLRTILVGHPLGCSASLVAPGPREGRGRKDRTKAAVAIAAYSKAVRRPGNPGGKGQ